MKAVGYYRSLPIDQDEALIDLDVEKPTPTGLKVFFGIPLDQNIDLEEIDPYK